jgi:hypothetical protein
MYRILVHVDGHPVSLPESMVGGFAVSIACRVIGRDPTGLRLRKRDGTPVGYNRPVGEVLSGGDELELVRVA